MRNNAVAEHLAFSLSVASLAFLPMWIEFFYRTEETAYYRSYEYITSDYLAACLVVLLFSAVIYGVIRFTNRYQNKYLTIAADFFLLSIYVLIANVFRYEMRLSVDINHYIEAMKQGNPGVFWWQMVAFCSLAWST